MCWAVLLSLIVLLLLVKVTLVVVYNWVVCMSAMCCGLLIAGGYLNAFYRLAYVLNSVCIRGVRCVMLNLVRLRVVVRMVLCRV